MEEIIAYLALLIGLVFGVACWCFLESIGTESSCGCDCPCNCNNKQNVNQPKYTAYTIIDGKNTSSTKL